MVCQKNSLGKGHGVRVGGSIGNYGNKSISKNDHTFQNQNNNFKVIFGIKVCHD